VTRLLPKLNFGVSEKTLLSAPIDKMRWQKDEMAIR